VDAPAYPHTGKVKTMVIPCWDLYQMLAGERPRRAMGNMPPDGQIVGAELTGNQLRLTIRADSLPAVGAGQPVPEEWARFVVLEVTVGGRFV
jgi:hypothetical protein